MIDRKQEEYIKRAMEYYFNMIDTDKNGVITFPEFTKLAVDFSAGPGKSEAGELVILVINSFINKWYKCMK